jgi:hypothetical protein
MIFDFLTEDNFIGTIGAHLMEYSVVECYKIPEHRQPDVWACVGELNDLFRKHAVEISFIRNPYIDFLNFDTRYHPNVHVCRIPVTKTGRPAKYSHNMYFAMPEDDWKERPNNNTFGEIYFYPSGRTGKAEVIFWRDRNLYIADFRSTKEEELYLWRVYKRRDTDNKIITLFENNQKA